jgi:hypothetical protein
MLTGLKLADDFAMPVSKSSTTDAAPTVVNDIVTVAPAYELLFAPVSWNAISFALAPANPFRNDIPDGAVSSDCVFKFAPAMPTCHEVLLRILPPVLVPFVYAGRLG